MGKKKWTGPNERKRQHMHRSNKSNGGGRGGANRFGGKSRHTAKPAHEREERIQPAYQQENAPPRAGLTEKDVGITEYVGKTSGFTGIIKARYVFAIWDGFFSFC